MPQHANTATTKEVEDLLLLTGDFGNKSEVHRQGVISLWENMPTEKRVHAAVSHYKDNVCTISKAAVLAGVPYHEMKQILTEEGVIRLGFDDIEKSKAAAKKFNASA